MDDVFEGPGFIRRVRRLADLSQRDLAASLGVSPATVGRLESGKAKLDAGTFATILGLAGLRLAVLDEVGREVRPVPPDTLVDNGGRRFPSHLDARPPGDQPPLDRGIDPRKGKPPATGWFDGRTQRDLRRARKGVPDDHPTVGGELEKRRVERAERLERARRAGRAAPLPECECLDECFEALCLADCPCQCEPARVSWMDRTE
ncbi:helix-turn-helix domain-containing protein [Monashia sp. NPDC004114]